MNILAIGDVVGSAGCEAVRRHLPALKKLKKIDICIANGENSADGNGLLPSSAEHLFASGVDVITAGNHTYRRREMYERFDSAETIIRPANFHENNPGKGYCVLDKGSVQVAVINLMGNVYMDDPLDNPFSCIEKILELEQVKNCRIKIVDFHAEATSEKRALGFFLDGKVSALFGTHTHVQTADEQILPLGTGYISDLGMSGPVQSVLGVKPEIIIEKLRTNMPVRFEFASSECSVCGCIFEIDEKTGKCLDTERLCIV